MGLTPGQSIPLREVWGHAPQKILGCVFLHSEAHSNVLQPQKNNTFFRQFNDSIRIFTRKLIH